MSAVHPPGHSVLQGHCKAVGVGSSTIPEEPSESEDGAVQLPCLSSGPCRICRQTAAGRQCDAGSPICEWMRETRAKLGTPQKRDQGQSVR